MCFGDEILSSLELFQKKKQTNKQTKKQQHNKTKKNNKNKNGILG